MKTKSIFFFGKLYSFIIHYHHTVIMHDKPSLRTVVIKYNDIIVITIIAFVTTVLVTIQIFLNVNLKLIFLKIIFTLMNPSLILVNHRELRHPFLFQFKSPKTHFIK